MGIFENHLGIMDVIRCDKSSYLVWKWHPEGTTPGHNKRENAIRFGSTLRVKNGEVAVFVYNQNNLYYEDYIEGPFDAKLRTENLPVLSSIIGLAYNGNSPFQAEVYFINLAKIIQIQFAIPYFDVFDETHPEFGIPVATRGTLNFHISNYMEFVKKHRLIDFDLDDFQEQIRSTVVRNGKQIIANLPTEKHISLLQLEREIDDVSEKISEKITPILSNEYGVDVTEVNISAIELDKSSDAYQAYISVTRDLSAKKAKAQNDADIKNIQDMQRINAENIAEVNRINREEAQYAQHKQTQTANFDAYKIEAQEHVGVAGAEGMGNMGNNSGSGEGGINIAGIMTGMSVGSAVGQNIAKNINAVSNATDQNDGTTPPPLPSEKYYVVINEKSTGPYNLDQLQELADKGIFTQDSYVWKKGMKDWMKAKDIADLQNILSDDTLPPLPKN